MAILNRISDYQVQIERDRWRPNQFIDGGVCLEFKKVDASFLFARIQRGLLGVFWVDDKTKCQFNEQTKIITILFMYHKQDR